MKKAGPFRYKTVKKLPEDSDITNTRFYLMTDQGNYWCSPFKEKWQTFPEEMTNCLKILNMFAIRVDLDIATRCKIGSADLDIGENIAFQFDVPVILWKQPERITGSKGNDGVRRPAGQSGTKVRFVHGQDGRLAIRGMARNSSATNGTKRGHSLAQLQREAHPTGKSLSVRPENDKDANPGD